VTTTPRPTKIVRDLLADPSTAITRGRTYDNRANLAAAFFDAILRQYEGTRLGRQEIAGEVLDDAPGALWRRDAIDATRVVKAPDLRRVVVAIDPAVTSSDASDETGIVVAGVDARGDGYVLDDLTGRYKPHEWAAVAVNAYRRHNADRIVAEVNNGGEMVEHTVRTVDRSVAYKSVHASRGKAIRAEPVAALYEQGRVHHVGSLASLEDQLCGWDPGADARSPDRLDALVWALTELMVADSAPRELTEEYFDR
jgi:phage terminase large subunit-like protein